MTIRIAKMAKRLAVATAVMAFVGIAGAVEPIKIGLHPHVASIWLLYNDGGKLRQRLMPVRDLRRIGAERAARALSAKHAKYLAERVNFAQLKRLCNSCERTSACRKSGPVTRCCSACASSAATVGAPGCTTVWMCSACAAHWRRSRSAGWWRYPA